MSILSKGYIYVEVADWDIPVYEDVITSIRNRIDEIRNENTQSTWNIKIILL